MKNHNHPSSISNICGKKFTNYTVIDYVGVRGRNHLYLCSCACGEQKVVQRSNLLSGHSKSCGCLNKKYKSFVGKKYGRLTVVSDKNGVCKCVCSCGEEKEISKYSLTSGDTRSCGCFREDVLTTHGKTHSPEYLAWDNMIGRCHRKSVRAYYRYGGRGIVVCDSWRQSFEAFYAYIGDRPSNKHSLDRIDNDGNYEPGNVRWATRSVQDRNKSSNVQLEFNGKTMVASDWAEELGIKPHTLTNRIKSGMPKEKIFHYGILR